MVDVADKLAYFQAITGLEDPDLCTEILAAHGWDLELAISSITSTNTTTPPANSTTTPAVATSSADDRGVTRSSSEPPRFGAPERSEAAAGPGLAWKIVTLPISVILSSLSLISGAI